MILGTTLQEKRMLYHYHNAALSGQVYLAFKAPIHGLPKPGLMIVEQNARFPENGILLGEVRAQIVNDRFIDIVIPLCDRSEAELRRRARATARHRARRLECWRRYSFTERIADLQAGQT